MPAFTFVLVFMSSLLSLKFPGSCVAEPPYVKASFVPKQDAQRAEGRNWRIDLEDCRSGPAGRSVVLFELALRGYPIG
jgi:hypothetical protein